MDLPDVARDTEVAEYIGATRGSLAQDRHRRRGIPYVRIGGRIRYLRSDVLAYLDENRVVADIAPGGAA
jgi:hypothetical protein